MANVSLFRENYPEIDIMDKGYEEAEDESQVNVLLKSNILPGIIYQCEETYNSISSVLTLID